MLQDSEGHNCLMHAIPWPGIISTILDFVEDSGRPDSGFWRQRNRQGRSLLDLAKDPNPGVGNARSLQLLTQFITCSSSFTAFIHKSPDLLQGSGPPTADSGIDMSSLKLDDPNPVPISRDRSVPREMHVSHGLNGHSTRDRSNQREMQNNMTRDPLPTRSRDPSRSRPERDSVAPVHGGRSPPQPELLESKTDYKNGHNKDSMDVDIHPISPTSEPINMKRSKSLREFWEKETRDWFASSPSDSLSYDMLENDPTGPKLPPIRSPVIKYDEWRERGHSLNRRTSVNFLRAVNPIH